MSELQSIFDEAAGARQQEGRVSGTSDADTGSDRTAAPPGARPQHNAIQPPSISPFEQQQDGSQAGVPRLSFSRSHSGSQHSAGGNLPGSGCGNRCRDEGAMPPPARLPLQPYGQQVAAQLRRCTLASRALLEEMQAQLPGLAGGGHKPRLPSSALRFCTARGGSEGAWFASSSRTPTHLSNHLAMLKPWSAIWHSQQPFKPARLVPTPASSFPRHTPAGPGIHGAAQGRPGGRLDLGHRPPHPAAAGGHLVGTALPAPPARQRWVDSRRAAPARRVCAAGEQAVQRRRAGTCAGRDAACALPAQRNPPVELARPCVRVFFCVQSACSLIRPLALPCRRRSRWRRLRGGPAQWPWMPPCQRSLTLWMCMRPPSQRGKLRAPPPPPGRG